MSTLSKTLVMSFLLAAVPYLVAGQNARDLYDVTGTGSFHGLHTQTGTLHAGFRRKLNFRAYGVQRYVKELAPLPLQGLSTMTNRTFDENGNETNGTGTPPLPARNELAKRLFGDGAISPEDDWSFELIPQEILGVPAGTAIDTEELDFSEIQDAVLSVEYDVTPHRPITAEIAPYEICMSLRRTILSLAGNGRGEISEKGSCGNL